MTFRELDEIDHVIFEDLVNVSVEWETSSDELVNDITFVGSTVADGHTGSYSQDDSILAYGERYEHLSIHALIDEADADAVVEALLDDVAFPEPTGTITIHHGDTSVRPGDVIELRRHPVDRVTDEIDGEWGHRFSGRLVARVRSVIHTLEGRHIKTKIELTSPLRTLERPLSAVERSQATDSSQFQFRLDDIGAALDTAYHLD